MYQLIVSMGYKTHVSNKYPLLCLSFDFNSTGFRPPEKGHHAHVVAKDVRLAQVSLDFPFNFKHETSEFTSTHRTIISEFIKQNILYVHFVWKLSSNLPDYDAELAQQLTPGLKAQFRLRFNNDNPNKKIPPDQI